MESIKKLTCLALFIITILISPFAASQEESEYLKALRALNWHTGPGIGYIVDRAIIALPEDYGFLSPSDTDKFLELNQNLASGSDQLFMPLDYSYSAYFSFSESGYIKDDDELDADSILQTITESTEAANVEKQKKGWPALHVKGWHTRPHFDSVTKRLEWALDLESADGSPVINHNTRFLGRKGVVEAVLVANPDQITNAIYDFNQKVKDFKFNSGEKYTDYRDGDKVAEYGLAALVAGGAAAVVAKGGAKFLKPILIGIGVAFLALFGWLKNLFRKKNS